MEQKTLRIILLYQNCYFMSRTELPFFAIYKINFYLFSFCFCWMYKKHTKLYFSYNLMHYHFQQEKRSNVELTFERFSYSINFYTYPYFSLLKYKNALVTNKLTNSATKDANQIPILPINIGNTKTAMI